MAVKLKIPARGHRKKTDKCKHTPSNIDANMMTTVNLVVGKNWKCQKSNDAIFMRNLCIFGCLWTFFLFGKCVKNGLALSLSPSVCVSQLWISRLLNDNKTHEFELCAFSNSLFLITRTNNIWIAYLRMGNRVDNIDWNSWFDKYCWFRAWKY